MMGIENFWIFLGAGIVLNLTPGADTMYIVSRSVVQGRKAGLMSVLGISSGSIVHTTAAAVGLSGILASSATAFAVVKFLGAIYLVYLGIATFRAAGNRRAEGAGDLTVTTNWRVFRQGFLTNLLNPKIAVFFLAFLPQFVEPASPHRVLAFFTLGLIFTTTGTAWCLVVAWLSADFSAWLRQSSRAAQLIGRGAGILIMGLGVRLATDTR
jgi:threonine/homoserine/homoserine lactone efflux protein